MASKKVLITFNRAPFGTIHYVEGLRAALGIASGWDEHHITMLFLGDGAKYAINGVNKTDALKYLNTLGKLGFGLTVEKESLEENNISEEEVSQDFKIVARDEVVALLEEADVNVDF